MGRVAFESLVGKTFKSVVNSGDKLDFETIDGEKYKMFHQQDCCEHVSIEDIVGDLNDLIGSPILAASETSNQGDSQTWTYYSIATIKGAVSIRWYGESNGYYSESVDLIRVSP